MRNLIRHAINCTYHFTATRTLSLLEIPNLFAELWQVFSNLKEFSLFIMKHYAILAI